MSNETLLKKFDALDPHAQDQLIAFWDFLLAQTRNQSDAVMSLSYRERISKLSVWTEEDLAALEEANHNWNWEPPNGNRHFSFHRVLRAKDKSTTSLWAIPDGTSLFVSSVTL